MAIRRLQHDQSSSTINITPIIDIVFLLIIFFMLVCQYITAENFDVAVPDHIDSATKADQKQKTQNTAVTVMYDEGGNVRYAVGATLIETDRPELIPTSIAATINTQLQTLGKNQRTVMFRNDREIPFKYTKYALAGISQSSATDVKWAVIKDKDR